MPTKGENSKRAPLVLVGLLTGAIIWASWPVLRDVVNRWEEDPRYSHGFLVPVFAVYLLWHRREFLSTSHARPSWWALPFLVLGSALKLAGARYYVEWLDALAIPFWVLGVGMALGGKAVLRWVWPAAAFLLFMIPLPFRLEQALGSPLQGIATRISTVSLQVLGQMAIAEGHVIRLPGHRVNVAEACNGLGMLMMFLAYAVGAGLVVRRPLLDRILIVLSAIPIAILANSLRITVTGWLYMTAANPAIGDAVYHDLAGWLMMPLALAMLGVEFWILDHLFVEKAPEPVAVPTWKAQLETGVHSIQRVGKRPSGP